MNTELLVPLLITTVVAVIGWFIAHQQSLARDRQNKRRDIRVQYLIEAWRQLEAASNRNDNSRADDLEKAIADIQLFGSERQIKLAQRFAQDFASRGSATLDELLEALRNDLRKELLLQAPPEKLIHLRIVDNHDRGHDRAQMK